MQMDQVQDVVDNLIADVAQVRHATDHIASLYKVGVVVVVEVFLQS